VGTAAARSTATHMPSAPWFMKGKIGESTGKIDSVHGLPEGKFEFN